MTEEPRDIEFGVCGDVAYSIWEQSWKTLRCEHIWNTAYVGVPKGHPWYGLDYDAIKARGHGGLTFTGDFKERMKECILSQELERALAMNLWWVGVDWNHAADHDWHTEGRRYSIEDVRKDIQNLCSQAMEAARKGIEA